MADEQLPALTRSDYEALEYLLGLTRSIFDSYVRLAEEQGGVSEREALGARSLLTATVARAELVRDKLQVITARMPPAS